MRLRVGVVTGLALVALGEYLEQMVAYFREFLASWNSSCPRVVSRWYWPGPTAQIAGMMGAGTAMSAVLCLLLARYWQAALYNPGGFGEEFQALALPGVDALVLALAHGAGQPGC